jgi:uncharacterized protein (TIGR00375 family)
MEKVNSELGKRGKLASDGRPILGLTAKNVLEILLEADENSIMIPAHVWTPWFGVLGQNGGFDSLEECFEDLTRYIYAVETGLSSDPQMNWRVKELDKLSIVSFSDAHSAPKMGRELTIFDTDVSYEGLLKALKGQKIERTVEFYPEEGKYHYNGHRACNFKETPKETLARSSLLCPVCTRPLTIGVMHRVDKLAEKDRPEDFENKSRPIFNKLVPLLEILSEVEGSASTSNKVRDKFLDLISKFGSELDILLNHEIDRLEPSVAPAIAKVRSGDIFIDPGYDGVYGRVEIWKKDQENPQKKTPKIENPEPKNLSEDQLNLF